MKFFKTLTLILSFSSLALSQQIETLTQEQKNNLFKEKTERRIKDLEQNIIIIGNKEKEEEDKVRAINTSVKYFQSEKIVFEVSSLNNPTRTYSVRQYLNKLKDLPYHQVEIKWFNSMWVSDFLKGTNGKYYGTIRLFQVFKGTGAEGENIYSDITTKDIPVEIDVRELTTSQGKKEVLIVKLGDVNVVETRKA